MDIRATSEQLSEPVKMYGLGEIYGPGGEYTILSLKYTVISGKYTVLELFYESL